MSKSSVINVKTDDETKRAVETIFSLLGITVSDAVNIFFRKTIMEKGIPFEVNLTQYNEKTMQAFKESEDICKNPHHYKSYKTVEELFDDLNDDCDDA